jgi:cytochrome c553
MKFTSLIATTLFSCLPFAPLNAAEPFAERAAPCLACHGEKGVMTKDFTDDDLRTYSDTLSKLPPPTAPPQDNIDTAKLERGRTLITQNRCNACHNLDLSGRDNIPRIADQRA